MEPTLVRYTVRPDQAERNEDLVRAVYEELEQSDPAGLRYATFVLDDGVSFVHLALVDTRDGHNPLNDLTAFSTFLHGLGDRCAAPPVVAGLRPVGSYHFDIGERDA